MSAETVANLARIWEKLRFARVSRVIARDPEDVLSITFHNVRVGEDGYTHLGHQVRVADRTTRVRDIPRNKRLSARVAWRNYYGFTDDGVFFHMDGYNELDLDIGVTLDFSGYGNHTGGFDKPKRGDLICGNVIDTPKGKRFERWFVCSPELKYLIELVRSGSTDLSEEALAPRLITNGFPDKLWAIARLVFFDSVAPFADPYLTMDSTPHPCFGQEYGKPDLGGKRYVVEHTGMYLPKTSGQFVHLLSHALEQPQWWEEMVQLVGATPECVGMGGYCRACEAERRADDPWDGAPGYLTI